MFPALISTPKANTFQLELVIIVTKKVDYPTVIIRSSELAPSELAEQGSYSAFSFLT